MSCKHGVSIIGYTDLPSRLAAQSSQLYATNLRHLLTDLTPEKDGNIVVDLEDEVVRGATVCKDGETTWPPPHRNCRRHRRKQQPAPAPVVAEEEAIDCGPIIGMVVAGAGAAWAGRCRTAVVHGAFHGIRAGLLRRLHGDLECDAALHTPLMSVTNAISSIIVIGALLQISSADKVIMWIAVATV